MEKGVGRVERPSEVEGDRRADINYKSNDTNDC